MKVSTGLSAPSSRTVIYRGSIRPEDETRSKWWRLVWWYWIPHCGSFLGGCLFLVWRNQFWILDREV